MEQGNNGDRLEVSRIDFISTRAKKYKLLEPIEVIESKDKDGFYIASCPALDIYGSSGSKEGAFKSMCSDFHFCVENLDQIADGQYGVHMIDKVPLFKKLLGL